MLIVLPNVNGATTYGSGGKSSKIRPTLPADEEEISRSLNVIQEEQFEDEATYDPRRAEEMPQAAIEEYAENVPRAERVDEYAAPDAVTQFSRRFSQEGNTLIPVEGRLVTSEDLASDDEQIEAVTFDTPFLDKHDDITTSDMMFMFITLVDSLTFINRRIGELERSRGFYKERQNIHQSTIELDELKEKLLEANKVKKKTLRNIKAFEKESGFDYNGMVEMYNGDKFARTDY